MYGITLREKVGDKYYSATMVWAGLIKRRLKMTMNDMYLRLTYEQYKAMEEQMKNFDKTETTHKTVEGSYHKAFRLKISDTMILEFQGPLIKPPLEEKEYTGDGILAM